MHAWEGDPRQKPTPDYGSLGLGSDIKPDNSLDPRIINWRVLIAIATGVLLGVFFVSTRTAQAAWVELSEMLTLHGEPAPASPAILSEHERENLDQESPQGQAQLLLERAINHYDGANDQIAARVDGWRGSLKLTAQLNSLITTALNSNDLRVRAAGIELDIAAWNVAKTPASIDHFIAQTDSGEQSQRVWALWMLGLLGNRGVEPERVGQVLVGHLQDPNPEIRHWAVEGLAYLGTDATIAPLLQIFHDDASPFVRERAACSLAQSGMLSQEQRRTAIPQLLDYSEDASLDAQTHTWVYQALRDITGQNLPNEPAAWRNWFSSVAH